MKKPLWIAALALQTGLGAAWAEPPTLEGQLTTAPNPGLAAPVGTAITYQGKLDKNGVPVNGSCNFVFRLHDALAAGTQIGPLVPLNSQPVTNGQFTVSLDFGANAFDGQARWVSIEVQGPGDAGFTTLTPRQPITPAPYALYALGGPVTGQWTTDASGVNYGGSVGIGASSNSSWKLNVDGGTANNNALYVHSNNANYATFFVRNFASNGWGFFDDTSARHRFNGRVEIGNVTSPVTAKLDVDVGTAPISAGYFRANNTGYALAGQSLGGGVGVYGTCGNSGRAIDGWAGGTGWAVTGSHTGSGTYAVLGTPGEALYANSSTTIRPAARFVVPPGGVALQADGEVRVKQLVIQGGADLAERFEISETTEPGMVMVIDPESPGRMRVSDEAYSHRVAGVVSGSRALAAGVILGADETTTGQTAAIALSGRVWVKCDARQNPIRPGDLLTTSSLPGHAMAAEDRARSAGAVLGKAMSALEAGTGMVLVLVSLQ